MNKRQSSNQRNGGGLSGGAGSGHESATEERPELIPSEDIDEGFDNIDAHSDDSVGMRARMSSF